jgi:SAM-dependent methyltransferase
MSRKNPLTETETSVKETPYSSGEWKVVECQETGMVFLQNPPDYSQLVDQFAWEKTYEEESARRRKEEPVLAFASNVSKTMRRNFRKRERIEKVAHKVLSRIVKEGVLDDGVSMVDVGCGTGEKLVRISSFILEQQGVAVRPLGVEISAQLAKETNERLVELGGRCIHSNAVEGVESLEDASVDLVVFCSYLEHEVEPMAVLRAVSQKLRKGGYVIIKVPNYGCWNRHFRQKRWCGFRYPDHVNYFTPNTLTRMIETSGLKLWKMNFYDRLPTNDNVWAIARR